LNLHRHKILTSTINLIFVVIIIRLFYWQIIRGPSLKKQALSQTQKIQKISPQRGDILTSDNFPLAINQNSYQLSLYKPNLEIPLNQVINKIDNIKPDFAINNGSLIDKFKNNPQQLWISFPVHFTTKEKDILSLPGVSFQTSASRLYPESQLAKNIIGTLGQDQRGTQIGYGGLEAYYDKQLRGQTGFIKTAKDAVGQTILSQKVWQSNTHDGRHLHTFLNRKIQFLVEQKLEQGLNTYSAESGSIIVTNPIDGSIIAMASLTATDSAHPATPAPPRLGPLLGAEATKSATTNFAISSLFEPGSIFKPLIVAMALDSQSINPDYTCPQCHQPRTIVQYTISNWDLETNPDIDLKDTLKDSDNISMSFIIDALGQEKFLEYFDKLSLNQKTGIDLQGEAKPLVKSYWSHIDLATASFGQGFAITQLQMIHAFNALANDGQTIKPQIVNYFSENNKIIHNKVGQKTKIFSSKTTNQIKDYLQYTVENSNLEKLRPAGLEVCAKSGTAQIAQHGQYQESSTIASFIGFSPCHQPRFSLIVTLVKPQASPWGSTTAAPIWFDLASRITHLL